MENKREPRPAGGPVVTLNGSREAVIDGCDGVVEYGPEQVLLRAGRLGLCLRGSGLRIRQLTENGAVIQGRITALELDPAFAREVRHD